jgi:cell division protein FtsZ
LITTPGLINTDFADVKMTLTNAGSALMGIGVANGENRAEVAARDAISSPMLEAAIDGARGILLNITGPSSMGLFEVGAVGDIVRAVAHEDANIIFDEMGDEIKVTVIAAGFERWDGGASSSRSSSAPRMTSSRPSESRSASNVRDIFSDSDPLSGDDDDFDVPSFLK